MNQSMIERCSGEPNGDVGQERLVLAAVLVAVGAAVVEAHRIDRGVGDGVELVVAEHDLRRAGLDHRPHQPQRLELAGATIDQVADEHRRPVRVRPDAVVLGVAHEGEQAAQPVGVTVHVTDDVEPRHHPSLAEVAERGRVLRVVGYELCSSRSRYARSVVSSKQTKRTVVTDVGVERTVSTAMSVAASSG